MGMLTARIRKQDQVNRDMVLVQPNKKGGAVRTAAIGNNIDMLTSSQSLFISKSQTNSRYGRFGSRTFFSFPVIVPAPGPCF